VSVRRLPDGARRSTCARPTSGPPPGAHRRAHPDVRVTNRLHELPEDEDPLYVICRSGARSARVVAYLVAQGHAAVNVDGGMQAWAMAGRPLVSDGPGEPEIV